MLSLTFASNRIPKIRLKNEKTLVSQGKTRVFDSRSDRIRTYDDSDAKQDMPCTCENCRDPRDANALHSGSSNGHSVAIDDPDLQSIVDAWKVLPSHIRLSILTLAKLR